MDERERLILRYIKGKAVLDLGVGDISYRFFHKFVHDNAKKALGIELNPERTKKLIKLGYLIKVGNAENFVLNDKFDVVTAGDLIEHLNNPGNFLETVKKHLGKNGIFILNTPNAYSINFVLRGLFKGGNVPQFKEHTFLFTENLLRELLKRYNFKIDFVRYFSHQNKDWKSKVIRFFSFFAEKWNENILIIARVSENEKIK